MSWQAQAWAIEMGKRYELEPNHRWMLMVLANYADPEGNDIFPSVATLMADTGFSESSVRRHIRHLIQCGLMDYGQQEIVALKINRGDRRPKVYRLCMTVDKSPNGVSKRGVTVTESPSTGCQEDASRGVKRGVTVTPNPLNLKENLCANCGHPAAAHALGRSGACPGPLMPDAAAAAEGAAFRAQLRLKRFGRMPA
jgi:hypothetical protein